MHIHESDTDVIESTLLNMYVFKSLINAVAYYYLALDIIILYIHFFNLLCKKQKYAICRCGDLKQDSIALHRSS